jgi:Zn-dependent oligopeptidase
MIGPDAVPGDFVEAPSQMLEKWLQDPAVIRTFAMHYETGEPMPEPLLQSLVQSKNAFIGHRYEKQVGYGKADLRIHSYKSFEEIPSTYQEIYEATNEDVDQPYKVPDGTSFLSSFEHLFGG